MVIKIESEKVRSKIFFIKVSELKKRLFSAPPPKANTNYYKTTTRAIFYQIFFNMTSTPPQKLFHTRNQSWSIFKRS